MSFSRGRLTRQDQLSLPGSSRRLGHEYEVFLSFRGPDTRKGFTDFLYHSLRDAGIHVFLDNEEIPAGNEIGFRLCQGIQNSKISIPIFSQGYADSKWCLQELDLIAKCWGERKQIVMPIFYDVTPDQVKHHTGSYAEALRRHTTKYPKDVQQWKESLSELGRLKGWELESTADGHQGKFIKIVVASVLRELKKDHLPVTKTLVGIDNRADEVMSLLDVGIGNASVVGIYGISGIGKTTLAKDVYNKLLHVSEFEGCSSLDNIRERALQPNGLAWLQSKLVADITRNERRDFDSVDEGTRMLMDSFREKKVLILLDDVSHISQLNALVAECDWFGPGSRIIVTTKDGGILREAPQVNNSYEIEAMEHDAALELLSLHAFKSDPSSDPSTIKLISLAKQVVKVTGRIPMALEVIGRYLCDRSVEEWQAMLAKLTVRPDKEITNKLRISYDDLEDEYKQIFLDVACFFTGVDFRVVVHMWRDCQYFPDVGIHVLLHRSLVKIGEDNKLWMHDALQDFGRDIVRQENKAPEMRSRLWCNEEARNILLKNKGTEKIEAISIQTESGGSVCSFAGEQFRGMSNLRFLRLDCADLVGDFGSLSELRWLSWKPSSGGLGALGLPNNLPLEKMRIMEMSQSKITNDWIGWSSIKKAAKLKVLNLSGCHGLTETPDLSMSLDLEILNLENCKKLGKFQELKVDLPCLSSLNLNKCSSIKELPNRLSSLINLKELIVDGTLIDRLPNSIISLVNIRKLSANYCRNLERLPSSIGNLSSLVELSLSHTSVEVLPDSVGNLGNLEMLDISFTGISRFPRVLEKLLKLREINASNNENLTGDIPCELGKLYSLEVLRLDWTNISSIPETINELSLLQTLHLMGCSKLQRLPELPVSLVSVRVTCPLVEGIPNLHCLVNLEELVLSVGTVLRDIGFLPRLKVLSFQSCTNLDVLAMLPRSLQKLNISNCSVNKPTKFSKLQKLSELSLEGCHGFKELPDLRHFAGLKSLKVKFFPGITTLHGLEKLESLRMLQVSNCQNFESLPKLSKLKKLRVVNTRGCEGLGRLKGLGSLYGLTDLDIGNCRSIKNLSDLSKLKLLRTLSVDGCEKLQELKGLGALEELLHLNISGCGNITKLPDLSRLKKLKYLNIAGCKDISEVSGLSGLVSLQSLVISRQNLAKLQDLPEASHRNSPGRENASIVSQIVAERDKHLAALSGPWSAPEEPSSWPIDCFSVSIKSGKVIAIYKYDNNRGVISVP